MSTTASLPVGLATGGEPAAILDLVGRADAAGVPTLWTVMSPIGTDTPTLLAAALARTERVTVGTAIVPAFGRHPVTLALQAQALETIAPGRLRLGVGTGNLTLAQSAFHADVARPLTRLREFLHVLRPALHDGHASFTGDYYGTDVALPRTAPTPLLVAALGEAAFTLAGELTDGALSWACPVDYLLDVAAPAVAKGAASAGRPAPPIVAHVPVVLATDRATVHERAKQHLGFFGQVRPFADMFAAAGYPVGPGGELSEGLVDDVVVSGDAHDVAGQLAALADHGGLGELMVSLLPGPNARQEEDQLLTVLASLS
jgi:alkanesulfonate monooxygenase SsuD/methylene tetrahydromethanopterin reductase-like flavin-dependent oxidoreductase (luciferase family)